MTDTGSYGGTIEDGGTAKVALEMDGSGKTLTLTGTNSYTGGTTITAGTVDVSADANLGGVAGGVTLNGGTLDITADGFSSTRGFTLGTNGGTVSVASTDSATLSGTISGSHAFNKDGAGTLILTGAGTMGAIEVKDGELEIGDGTSTYTVSGTTGKVDADATLYVADKSKLDLLGDLTNNGTVTNYGEVDDALVNTGEYDNYGVENADVASKHRRRRDQQPDRWHLERRRHDQRRRDRQRPGRGNLRQHGLDREHPRLDREHPRQYRHHQQQPERPVDRHRRQQLGWREVSNTGRFGTSSASADATVESNAGTIDNGDGTTAGTWYGDVDHNVTGTIKQQHRFDLAGRHHQ